MRLITLSVLSALALSACGGGSSSTSTSVSPNTSTSASPGRRVVDAFLPASHARGGGPHIAEGTDVRIGGVRVGRVISVARSSAGIRVEMAIDPGQARISPKLKAVLRPKTLLVGSYVELTRKVGKGR